MKAMSSSSNVGGRRWFVPLGTRLAILVCALVTCVAVASDNVEIWAVGAGPLDVAAGVAHWDKPWIKKEAV